MASREQMIDILRVEGIMSQGYGLNPKIVMRDKRLTPEAKCIYGYLASFAGSGNQAFPSRDIMLDELQISKNRYYKHLKYLVDADYIRIERTKQGSGMFDRNIYTIVALPNPKQTEYDNNKKVAEDNQTAVKEEKTSKKKLQVKERASVNELRGRLGIEELKQSDPEHVDLIEDIFLAVEDLNASEQISIGGNIKKKEAIQELLNQLTADHIRIVVRNMSSGKKLIVNRKSYLQACITNSIFEIRNNNAEAKDVISIKKQEEALEKEESERLQMKKRDMTEAYERYPKLKELDENITNIMKKISRAVLLGNEILLKSLQNENEILQEKRLELLRQKSLEFLI